jgi:hypothetical protein
MWSWELGEDAGNLGRHSLLGGAAFFELWLDFNIHRSPQ